MTYRGQENATRDGVRRYLRENYSESDGTALSDARLTELLTDHDGICAAGHRHAVVRLLRRRPDRRNGRPGLVMRSQRQRRRIVTTTIHIGLSHLR